MGYTLQDIPPEEGIERARHLVLISWDGGLTRKIEPKKVVRAVLRDDGTVYLYYHNPQAHYGYRGRGDNELVQEFTVTARG